MQGINRNVVFEFVLIICDEKGQKCLKNIISLNLVNSDNSLGKFKLLFNVIAIVLLIYVPSFVDVTDVIDYPLELLNK